MVRGQLILSLVQGQKLSAQSYKNGISIGTHERYGIPNTDIVQVENLNFIVS